MSQKNSNNSVSQEEDLIKKARDEAEKDIEKDPSVNMEPKPRGDLDEGELAREEGAD